MLKFLSDLEKYIPITKNRIHKGKGPAYKRSGGCIPNTFMIYVTIKMLAKLMAAVVITPPIYGILSAMEEVRNIGL